jgi:hypothetical protein
MKTPIIILTLVCASMLCTAQIAPPSEGKAVVYIVRTSSLGFAIKFSYFDSTAVIGRFNGPKYVRYECDPGTHLFWAMAENSTFVEANVDAGRIYFIQAVPKMGAVEAGVKLEPVDPKNEDAMGRILKLMNKKPAVTFTNSELAEERKLLKKDIQNGIARYTADKAKGEVMAKLSSDMYYSGQ